MEVTLRQRLEEDLKTAMKSGDQVGRETIRFTLAAIKNAEIDKRGPLTPDDEIALLQRETKRRAESIDQFRAGKREDLVANEEAQLAILQRYLPPAMTDEELATLVASVIAEVGAAGPKDMGRVMPVLLPRVAGRADGKRVSTAVRDALASK
jgi:uncharacterized protein YqeY